MGHYQNKLKKYHTNKIINLLSSIRHSANINKLSSPIRSQPDLKSFVIISILVEEASLRTWHNKPWKGCNCTTWKSVRRWFWPYLWISCSVAPIGDMFQKHTAQEILDATDLLPRFIPNLVRNFALLVCLFPVPNKALQTRQRLPKNRWWSIRLLYPLALQRCHQITNFTSLGPSTF